MRPKPGVYLGIPDAHYRAWDAVSQTGLKTLLRSPAKFRWEQQHPRRRTPAMLLGSLMDCLCLEPDAFGEYFEIVTGKTWPNAVCAECGASPKAPCMGKKGEAISKCHSGRSALHVDDPGARPLIDLGTLADARAIADAVLSHPTAGRLVATTQHQVSIVWQDAETELFCKGRIDCLDPKRYIADLKKTSQGGAHPDNWPREVLRWGLDVQASFYTDGYEQLTGVRLPWVWAAVEEEAPFDLGVYQAADAWIWRGRELYRQALRTYRHCLDTDTWGGYDEEPVMCNPPAWASRPMEVAGE